MITTKNVIYVKAKKNIYEKYIMLLGGAYELKENG
jgi:hypothetical protein|tara:strand:+ start:764 stop:868 length:105 start_codon:yes stop_codon:yes gene_type:complete